MYVESNTQNSSFSYWAYKNNFLVAKSWKTQGLPSLPFYFLSYVYDCCCCVTRLLRCLDSPFLRMYLSWCLHCR
ncbi:hypothetical protein AMTRI_Chr06g192390 [Amborella trichopoda]